MAHILLGLLGIIPGFGCLADTANAVMYLLEGKYVDAAICAIGAIANAFCIPGVSEALKAGKYGKYAIQLEKVSKFMANASGLLINGGNTVKQSFDMYHKYFVDKKDAGWDTLGELGLLALSALGTYFSAKGIKDVVAEWGIKGKNGADDIVQYEKLKSEYMADEVYNADRSGSGLKEDPSHRAASYLSKEQLAKGKTYGYRGGDGKYYKLLQVKGKMDGQDGIFEYIVNSYGQVTHQRFILGGQYTGFPNQHVPKGGYK